MRGMRPRQEILPVDDITEPMLEVLLDIRDLLVEEAGSELEPLVIGPTNVRLVSIPLTRFQNPDLRGLTPYVERALTNAGMIPEPDDSLVTGLLFAVQRWLAELSS